MPETIEVAWASLPDANRVKNMPECKTLEPKFTKLIKQSNAITLVCKYRGDIIGIIQCETLQDTVLIHTCYVTEANRRNGAGTAMIQHLIEYLLTKYSRLVIEKPTEQGPIDFLTEMEFKDIIPEQSQAANCFSKTIQQIYNLLFNRRHQKQVLNLDPNTSWMEYKKNYGNGNVGDGRDGNNSLKCSTKKIGAAKTPAQPTIAI